MSPRKPGRSALSPLRPVLACSSRVFLGRGRDRGARACVQSYKDLINADASKVTFNGIQDPLAVATLLIHFFAEMPEPLLT